MSPDAPCPKCGKTVSFHDDEMKGVRKGTALCMNCTFEHQYNVFLVEVLQGKHPELAKLLKERFDKEMEERFGGDS